LDGTLSIATVAVRPLMIDAQPLDASAAPQTKAWSESD
jgi:hypothetical protein